MKKMKGERKEQWENKKERKKQWENQKKQKNNG